MEEWRPIEGYEGIYEVSSQGRVRSLDRLVPNRGLLHKRRGKVRGAYPTGKGYLRLELCAGGVRAFASVHRLVATAFVPRKPGKDYVNHLNGVKTDNRPENLEWCTDAENQEPARRALGQDTRRPVIATAPGRSPLVFASASEAGRNGFRRASVVSAARGRLKTHGGYTWAYADAS